MRLLRPQTAFGRNVLTLASGTALAQLIPVLASPLLTRLYGPAAFGILALYLSFTAIGTVVATGRYELAILLPKDDAEAADILGVAVASTVMLSGLAAIVLSLVAGPLAGVRGLPRLPGWALVVPAGMLAAAISQSLGYWINRRARYRPLVASRVLQSGTMFGVQVGGGALGSAAMLIGGHLAGQMASLAALARDAWRVDGALLGRVSWASMRRVAVLHRRFPAFIVPGHLANTVSAQVPTILLAAWFSPAVAGLYALAERVLVLPSSLLGNSIGDVYRQEAAETYNRQGECRALYLHTVRRLAVISLAPCALVVIAGPALFAFAFGDEWRPAGVMASALAAMVFFQMISSPLSQTVLLADLHRLELAWQLARVAASAGAMYAGYAVFHDAFTGVALHAAGFAVLHLLHSLMQYHAASGRSAFPRREPA